jgi:type I restriction enzyme, S subunit
VTWPRLPIKRLGDVFIGKMLQPAPKTEFDVAAPYLRAAHVQPNGQIIDVDNKTMWFDQAELKLHDLRADDVVIVEGGAGYGRSAVLRDDRDGWGFQKSIIRVRPRTSVATGRFLDYALQAALSAEEIEVACFTATIPHFTADKVEVFQVPAPPLGAQRAIADYLDRETARIDTLIEEQQRLIEMLRERRDSAWAARVEEARRLGQTLSIRRLIESIVDGPFGSSLTSAHYSDEGARVIRLGNIGANEFKDEDAAFIPLDYAEELEAHAVKQGDVVVAGLGDDKMPLGRAVVVPALGPAIVKADCYRLRPNEQVSAAYLAWVMSAPQTRSQIMLLARGSTRARLNTSVVQQVEVPLPDRSTQNALVAQSHTETAKISRLIAETERFIELARERRAALITATVTGQIDVREMV